MIEEQIIVVIIFQLDMSSFEFLIMERFQKKAQSQADVHWDASSQFTQTRKIFVDVTVASNMAFFS